MNIETDTTELLALLKLIDDPDPEVFTHIEEKVIEIGSLAVPYLEDAHNGNNNHLSNGRIETLLNKIQYNKTSSSLTHWKKQTEQNLIDGSLILTLFDKANQNEQKVYDHIDRLKKDVWLELNEEFTDLEKIHILNHVFFKIYNFKGNKTNLSQPKNSLINNLLENKQGNSVILSILYMEVAQSLNLPVYGVNLPENFILAYLNSGRLSSDSKALFYINPFNDGVVFTKEDIETFVNQLELETDKKYFEPCDNQTTLRRLMSELMQAYELAGEYNKSDDLKKLSKIL